MQGLTWGWTVSAVSWLGAFGLSWFAWVAAVLTLTLLTGIEVLGIRLYGRVHKARITATVALALTAHASVGWLVGGLLILVGLGTGVVLHDIAMHMNVGAVRGLMMLTPLWMPASGGFIGLVTFETIVYLGLRRCRFANRARDGA